MLEAALAWAARGFRIFPLSVGSKVPPRGMRFKQEATTDPEKIRSWWAFEPRYNVGVATGNGYNVVDVDVRKGGAATLLELDLPDATLTVSTPSGGWHLYLLGPDVQNSVDRLGPGVDIRSAGGYVVGPGSYFDDRDGAKGYAGSYAITVEAAMAEMPAGFVLRCGEPRARDNGAAVSVDHPDDLMYAVHFLIKDAPVAIEGRGGNATTYAVAARLIEIGVSAEAAIDILMEHWNPRCEPPWSRDELVQIAGNAGTYAQARQGSGGVAALADQGGDAADAITAPPPSSTGKFDKVFAPRKLRALEDIPPRDWVAEGLLLRRKAEVLSGPGTAGKSGFTLALAAHGAVGQNFAGYRIPRPFKTIIYNWEDDLDEMENRLHATCATYNLDVSAVERQVLLWPGEAMRFRLTNREDTIDLPDVREVARLTKSGSFDLIVLDPLNSLHTAEENDNTAMGEVMAAAAELCRMADAACMIVAHTAKGLKSASGAGTAEASRGAGNIINSVRLAHTMFPADEHDAMLYGFEEGYAKRYTRFDQAKNSYGPPGLRPAWFEKVSFPLPNGGTVQALRPIEVSENAKGEAKLMATILAGYMTQHGSMHLDLHSAAQVLRDTEVLFRENLPASGKLDGLRARVELRLADGVTLDSGAVIRGAMLMKDGDSTARRYITLA